MGGAGHSPAEKRNNEEEGRFVLVESAARKHIPSRNQIREALIQCRRGGEKALKVDN